MIFLILPLVLSQSCKSISCSAITSSLCLTTEPSLSLNLCPSNQYCPVTSFTTYLSGNQSSQISCSSSTTTVTCPTQATTGRYCCTNSNCVNGICNQNLCQGKFKGDSCITDSDCYTNLYCNPNSGNNYGTCVDAFITGQDCDFDNQCASGLGCSRGSCVGLLTVGNGVLTDQDDFCITQMRNPNNQCDSLEVFVNGVKVSNPFKCKVGQSCFYKYKVFGTTYSTQPCMCDGTADGNGYCGHYIIHDEALAADLVNHLTYTVSNCSGDDASSIDPYVLLQCGSMSVDDYAYVMNFTAVAEFWSVYQSGAVADCALQLGLFDPSWTYGFGGWVVLGWIYFM